MPEKTRIFKSPAGEAKNIAAYDDVLKHWPIPYEELDLPTRFGTTHIIVSGSIEAKPLILLHGQDSCAISWAYNIVDLSQALRVYAVDTIGDMGKSKPIQIPNSRKDYARWLLEIFDQLKLEKADLMGLSYGGFLAMKFALDYPERVNRIVLLAPGIPIFGPPTLQWVNYGMPMMLLPSRFTVKRFINGASTKGYSKADLVYEQMIIGMTNMRKVSFMRPVITVEELKRMTVSVLLLIGDREIMYEPKTALNRATRLIPNLQTGLIQNASHMLNSDQPEEVDDRVLKFLAKDKCEA